MFDFMNQDATVVNGNDVGHKWLKCILSAGVPSSVLWYQTNSVTRRLLSQLFFLALSRPLHLFVFCP